MGEASATEIPQDWYRSAFPVSHTVSRPWAEQTEPEIDRALAMTRPPEGARVLDVACGTGRHSIELAARGFEVVGVDIAEDLLEIAVGEAELKSVESVSFIHRDLRELDFDAEFDVVTSVGAFGHILESDEDRFVAAAARALSWLCQA